MTASSCGVGMPTKTARHSTAASMYLVTANAGWQLYATVFGPYKDLQPPWREKFSILRLAVKKLGRGSGRSQLRHGIGVSPDQKTSTQRNRRNCMLKFKINDDAR